jgi:hypothetical protein
MSLYSLLLAGRTERMDIQRMTLLAIILKQNRQQSEIGDVES